MTEIPKETPDVPTKRQENLTGYSFPNSKGYTPEYKKHVRNKNLNPEYELKTLITENYKETGINPESIYEDYTRYRPQNNGTKRTYYRDWTTYEAAHQKGKIWFYKILKNSVDTLHIEQQYTGNGRPPANLKDIIKSLCIRIYHHYSSYHLESELEIARAMGVIDTIPKRSTLNKYLQDPNITPILDELYQLIALPVSLVETTFSTDATGIGCSYGSNHWVNICHKKSGISERAKFVKLHIIAGNKTHAIISALVTTGHEHESPHLPVLLEKIKGKYKIIDFCADAGYLSRTNVKAILHHGGVPYIAGKKNVAIHSKGTHTPWTRMLYLWKKHQMFFAQHFHQRSNVESTFSTLKRRFVHVVRAKTFTSQVNETLCKIVCHNADVLSHAMLAYDLKDNEFVNTL